MPDVAFVRADRIPPGGVKGFFQGAARHRRGGRFAQTIAPARSWRRRKTGCRPVARLVWVVDPETRTISVYRSRSEITVLSEADTLTGGDVLPGFSVPVGEIFA